MTTLATKAREQAADLWTIEREYQPLPAEGCGCGERAILERWERGHHCFRCGHDLLPTKAVRSC